jgi:hypothetical protein
VAQLFEAAQGTGSLLFVVVGVFLGLVVILAVTAVFDSRPSRRKAALDVLRVLWTRQGTSSRDDRRDDERAE